MTVSSSFALFAPRPWRAGSAQAGDARPTALAMSIVALTATVPYLATLTYGFVYDDGPIIADNPALHSPAGLVIAWRVAYWPPAWGRAGLFRPVVQFLYSLLWNISGGAPWLFHLYAVALYAACAVALLYVFARALPAWAAMLGALLFAADPLHVESVANVAGSAESVAALASIACILVLSRSLDRAASDSRAIGWRPAIGAAALYAVALGAKESAVTVPALAALYTWGWRSPNEGLAPSARGLIERGWRTWTACALALGLMIVARRLVLGGLSPPSTALAVGLAGATLAERWWTMTAAWPLVAHLLFWPTRLSMHYGPTTVVPHGTVSATSALACVAVALLAGASAWMARRGDRRPLVALGWIAAGYLAASNILVPTGQLLAERTLFFSSAGSVMLAALVLSRAGALSAAARREVVAVALLLVVVGLAATVRRSAVWSSEERLFTSGIDFDSAAFYPYQQLARTYGRRGDDARGVALLGEAYKRYPAGESLALEYAQHLRTADRGEDALRVLRATSGAHLASQPVRLAYLDALLDRRGADTVIRAIDQYPGNDPAGSLRFVVLAHAYERRGAPDSVVAAYARAVAEDGDDPGLRYAYASALHTSHREGEAQQELDRAAASGAMPPAVRFALQARIALSRGDSAGARAALARAHAAKPIPGDSALADLDSALAAHRR